ncbi:MAG: hypothetical protein E7305_06130 [Butyrivibrio sp.]|nr:hypothetical protein [Butyrivibrio sp.]
MPPKLDHSNSEMAKSAELNKLKIQGLAEIYRYRRYEAGDVTNYELEGKRQAKKFSLFRWLFKKTKSNMGRFIPQTPQKQDSISAMDSNGKAPVGSYFDPLGLKIIRPKLVQELGVDDETDYEEADQEAVNVENDFVARVGDEIKNISENDYEEHLMDENSELALPQVVNGNKEDYGDIDELAEAYNGGRPFIPEPGYVEDIPDDFQIELKVYEAPPKYSLEWEQYRAEHTKGVSAMVKNFFRKMLLIKVPDMTDIESDFIESLPEYKRIRREGEQQARLMKQKYNPRLDNKLMSFKIQTSAAIKSESQGHSIVKLVATKNGKDLSRYSFMFGAIANGGISGASRGGVSNPAPDSEVGVVKARQNISYPNYLRAAAKVRGVVGSMKSYAFLRYNCTSFAAQIAQAAGLDIKPEDTTRKMMTFRHREERVETPYDFANYIRGINERQQAREQREDQDEAMTEAVQHEKDQFLSRREELFTTYSKFLPRIEMLNMLIDSDFATMQEAEDGFRQLIGRILTEVDNINKKYPIEGLEGDALDNVLRNRRRDINLSIGAVTEEGAISKLFIKENNVRASFLILNKPFTVDNVRDLFINNGIASVNADEKELVAKIRESSVFKERYMNIPEETGIENKLAEDILFRIQTKQEEIARSIIDACDGKENEKLIQSLNTALGEYRLSQLTVKILDSSEEFESFVQKSEIEFPKFEDYATVKPRKEKKEQKAPEDKKPLTRLTTQKAKEIASLVSDISSETAETFVEIFSKAVGIEGRMAGRPITSVVALINFMVSAGRMSELSDDAIGLYNNIIESKEPADALNHFKEFFNSVATKLNKEKLTSLMMMSDIE